MTAQEALERWEVHGEGSHIPSIYREMGLTRLRILAAEEAKPSPPSAMDRMPVPRLTYNPLDRALGRETPPRPAPAARRRSSRTSTARSSPKSLINTRGSGSRCALIAATGGPGRRRGAG